MKDLAINEKYIKNLIYTIRGKQVMLDNDLAELFQVETKYLNRAVKRNIQRFPDSFRFQLTSEEYDFLISQIVISKENVLNSQNKTIKNNQILRFQNGTSSSKHGGRRYIPYVFTEQGVSMLSAVLHSEKAIQVSIQIMNTFVGMRKFLLENATIFQKFIQIEQKLIKHDEDFEKIFKAIEAKEIKPKQGIFFEGQIFDAYLFISTLIKNAKQSITLIDNYIDETVLTLFSKNQKVKVTIYSKNITKQIKLDLEKYNSQYNSITIKKFNSSHDRFLIIDDKQIYHFGASLKDLGKKWFAFSKFDIEAVTILGKLER